MIDPKDFIITRKRKKYKFAKFTNSPICFEYHQWTARSIDVLEVGAGTGIFSVELAAKYPKKQFVALDVKADRLQKGAYLAIERGLSNIYFVRARADQITDLFTKNSIEAIWLTFPDPFVKKRSAKRRLTHARFLGLYQQLLKPNRSLYLKHDEPDFFDWSLQQLVESKWRIEELSFNIHETGLNDDYKTFTTYEHRWLDEGRQVRFVNAKSPR